MPTETPAARKTVLFVLAHQDDECLVSTRIARELEWRHRVVCAFLTDGATARAGAARRDAESRRVLLDLGVREEDLHFLGSRHGIGDQALAHRLEEAYQRLEEELSGLPCRRVYTLAFEGGHPDHDAAHLVALAYARRRGLLPRTWQIPAYHGHRTPGRLFRVQALLPRATRRWRRRLPAGLAWRHAWLPLRYPSQMRSWLGLWPELFVRRALLRREVLEAADPAAVRGRPHPGPLLYERMGVLSYPTFAALARPFVARRLQR
jgi:LmbE family N-acetylglucosaminyl deacetylase